MHVVNTVNLDTLGHDLGLLQTLSHQVWDTTGMIGMMHSS